MNAELRGLVVLVEQSLTGLCVSREPTAAELPLRLRELDVSRAIELVLPPAFTWEGRLVDDWTCASIREAVQAEVQARSLRNRRFENAAEISVRVRRAGPADRGWMSGKVEVATPSVGEAPVVTEPEEVRVLVSLDGSVIPLGPGRDRHPACAGKLLLVEQGGRLWVHPLLGATVQRLAGPARHKVPIQIDEGEQFIIEDRRWLFWRDVLARGQVLECAGRRPLATTWRAWGAVEAELDEAHPDLRVEDGASAVAFAVEPNGVLTLRNAGADPIRGTGRVGAASEFQIDRGWIAQALPGEVDGVQVGDRTVSLTASLPGSSRTSEQLVVVPANFTAQSSDRQRLIRDGQFHYALQFAVLQRMAGLLDWLVPLVDCRVDGRLARKHCAIPVRAQATVQIEGFRPFAI